VFESKTGNAHKPAKEVYMKQNHRFFKETGTKRDRLAFLRGLITVTALAAALAFGFTACGGGGGNDDVVTVANLADYLAGLPDNTADNPHTISLAAATNISGDDWAAINSAVEESEKYVILDLSACAAADNTIAGGIPPLGSNFNIIKDNAFITGVILPDSLTSVGSFTFYNCSHLTSIIIGDKVTSIEANAFHNCVSLTSVTIPAGVTSIGSNAFRDCVSLTSVTIENSVTSIGVYAFSGCTSLTRVTFAGNAAVVADANAFPSGDSLLTAGSATANGDPMQAGTYTLSGGTWTKSGS
jgi:hypothetical protein